MTGNDGDEDGILNFEGTEKREAVDGTNKENDGDSAMNEKDGTGTMNRDEENGTVNREEGDRIVSPDKGYGTANWENSAMNPKREDSDEKQ